MRRGTSGPPGGAAAPRPHLPPAPPRRQRGLAEPAAGDMGKKHKKHKSDKHPYEGGWVVGGWGAGRGGRERARRVWGLGPRPGRARRLWAAADGPGAAGPQPGLGFVCPAPGRALLRGLQGKGGGSAPVAARGYRLVEVKLTLCCYPGGVRVFSALLMCLISLLS